MSKGSGRRPPAVSEAEIAARWERTFGKATFAKWEKMPAETDPERIAAEEREIAELNAAWKITKHEDGLGYTLSPKSVINRDTPENKNV